MSKVVEAGTSERVLPYPPGKHSTVYGWQAFLACDADLRTKHKEWFEVAARLVVVADDVHKECRDE